LEPSDFSAKPMVLVLGQYSVGKTSFIRSLLVCNHILFSF
jgi:ABC-type branched-subunit amino acid transport system ATPase component